MIITPLPILIDFLTFSDNNGIGQETRLPLKIHIKDENDNLPVFNSNLYTYRVEEETTLLTTDQPISVSFISPPCVSGHKNLSLFSDFDKFYDIFYLILLSYILLNIIIIIYFT